MDNIEALKKYKELLDMGIITQEEFTAKKAQILGIAKETNTVTEESVPEPEAPSEPEEPAPEPEALVMEPEAPSEPEELVMEPEAPSEPEELVLEPEAPSEPEELVLEPEAPSEPEELVPEPEAPSEPEELVLEPEVPAEPETPEMKPDFVLEPEVPAEPETPAAEPELILEPEVSEIKPELTLEPEVPEIKPELTPEPETPGPGAAAYTGEIPAAASAAETAGPNAGVQQGMPGAAVPAKRKFPKIALIAIIAVLAGIIFFVVSPGGGIGKIQGTYKLVGISTYGEYSPITESAGGTLEVKGKKWSIEIHNGDKSSTISGEIKYDKENSRSGESGVYLYDFVEDGGSTLKAGKTSNNDMILVSLESYMDTDNCLVFDKK